LGRSAATRKGGASTLRVAAIRMTAKLGDVAANLKQAERLILEAQRGGADWIALPEGLIL